MYYRIFLSTIILVLAMVGQALSEPKRVLLLHSFGRDFAPWNEYARTFREELSKQSADPIDLYEASLATARYTDEQEGPFVEYLRALFVKRHLDLIAAIGAPAVGFVQRHRQQLFPMVPSVYTGIEKRRVAFDSLTENDSVVALSNDFSAVVENILQVLPETTNIAVVIGNSPIEQYWLEQLRTAFRPFEGRVTFTWFNKLSFEEMRTQASGLPPRSAIFFALLSVDAAGVPHEGGKALPLLRAVANAPVFSESDVFFGKGIVGGPLNSISALTHRAASVAVRILGGEPASSINTSPLGFSSPRYDWRELRRWNIKESRLPPGSQVEFRLPGIWEQYKLQVSAGFAVLALQAAMIAWLLLEKQRRYLAEGEASNRRSEVIRLNRVATASVLSSSIAHELNQPLGAILSNTEAAQIMLKADPPDLNQIGEILEDIVRDEQRASEIIVGLRNLLNNRKQTDLDALNLNDVVRDVVKIVGPEAAKREIILSAEIALAALPIRCDPIHLQQVMINLSVNGMDAMEDCERASRNLIIRTERDSKSEMAKVTVSDSGKGIPNKDLESVFDAFFTTKPQGTGLGLPIARTIIQTYGGKIWLESNNGATAFCFTLPLLATKH
jgi:signal transduction histidine kinase